MPVKCIAQLCVLIAATAGLIAVPVSAQQSDRSKEVERRSPEGLTQLHLALQLERRDRAIELIKNGADIDARTPYGATPLSMAIDKGYADVIDLLLDRNVVVESPSLEPGPLFAAIRADNIELFERLVARGAGANRLSWDGVSLLYFASSAGKLAFVSRLLDMGAEIDFSLPDGTTSLHVAVANLHYAVADLLYARGAAVTPAPGEVGTFYTALVYRFVAQKEYEKRNVVRSSEYLRQAASSYGSVQSLANARAEAFAHRAVRTAILNAIALAAGQAQANIQAQTSIGGVGTALVPQGSIGASTSFRDSYRNLAANFATEAQRMSAIQSCVAVDAGAIHDCFSNPAK
jgi:ankyrin repeat protein